ncbi:MAG: CYTH domain-containing protein [Chloroflexi bacterium]|nr:CYTH domain-containing protein [Chloroflexota bacterium]
MGLEIERKYLVRDDSWRIGEGRISRQGYIQNEKDGIVRVRIIGNKAVLTIKGGTTGITRLEYEYEIPVDEANEMLEKLCEKPIIEKIRHEVVEAGQKWEIDEFLRQNAGLVIAEIELEREDQEFAEPKWLGKEVSKDIRYLNAKLVKEPYSQWGKFE